MGKSLLSSYLMPHPQVFHCIAIKKVRIVNPECTSLWNCLGQRTKLFNSLVRKTQLISLKALYSTFHPEHFCAGRTHRSNQLHLPEYYTIISNVPGENRFVSAVTNRIQMLVSVVDNDSEMCVNK